MYKGFGKRLFDFTLAAAGLIILSPLFVFLTLLIFCLENKRPFFYQPRPGLNGKIFIIAKFKTMKDMPDADKVSAASETGMVRPVGHFLRRTALDELPQLWNVFRGDMSLVGPRPLLTAYLPHYNKAQFRRHAVKPGITGWAQVNGRNAISWAEKFEYDLWYVDHVSFQLDLKILLRTAKNIFFRRGEHYSKEELTQKFTG